ncbi:helix-turn-helix domain-containing protein [Micromonospora soli]|uniref:ArsR/SmtB family transcription factor n=1 Tax=Micromonospora sp. NBRC 110009 TaxID=3061627 RepID=UPI002673E753|nr:helix-turn-helix domain-containing protein [Micromonospora sp. NBRC 110009]WKT96746.1 helix-turn-helix domain-containing protein [Micromonospora sp. NBRC 110009]
MRDGEPGDVRQIDDVRALTALAHPDRARLMDALAVHGPSTTTALARAMDLATGSVSHHLKVLVEAGLVAPAPAAATDRRERRWKLVTRGMRWTIGQFRDQPTAQAAATSAEGALLQRQYEHAREFLETAEQPWDDVAYAGHVWLRLTPDELAELGQQIDDLLLGWRRRQLPEDGLERHPVLAFVHAFPTDP